MRTNLISQHKKIMLQQSPIEKLFIRVLQKIDGNGSSWVITPHIRFLVQVNPLRVNITIITVLLLSLLLALKIQKRFSTPKSAKGERFIIIIIFFFWLLLLFTYPQEAGAYFTLTCGPGVFRDTVNHSKSVINHFTVK